MTVKIQFSQSELIGYDAKINQLKDFFSKIQNPEEKYHFIIQLGQDLASFKEEYKTNEHLVKGCQSVLYLHAMKEQDRIFFSASTDALISKGLAALLIYAYSGESIETILKNPPLFLQDLGLYAALSPNRSQGLYHIYLKMRELLIKL